MIRSVMVLLAIFFSSAVLAGEIDVRRVIEGRFPNTKVASVSKTPYLGLYEVVIGDDIVYTDEKVTYIFNGVIVDGRTQRNLTQERLQKLQMINFDDLPLELAIKQVRGNGKRVVAVFSDPYCPFCRRLDQTLAQAENATVYTFLYPILRPEESPKMARQIWCAPDRAKAYYDFMLRNRPPSSPANCEAPVEKWLALGRKLAISATPVSFVPNGQRIVGARAEELQKLMDESVRH